MSSLLTEILISLVVIAIIGGIIGWLIRGVQVSSREELLASDIKQHQANMKKTREHVGKMEDNFKKLNLLRKNEREQLQRRINELEPLFDLVERRDNRIRELTDELHTLQNEKQAELEALQFDIGTRSLLGEDDSQPEIARLQSELNLANRQKDGAISRYQGQVRQIEDLENMIKERDKRLLDVNSQQNTLKTGYTQKLEEIKRQIEDRDQKLRDAEEQMAILNNKKQYELSLSEAKAEKAGELAQQLQSMEQHIEKIRHEHLTRENLLKEELSGLRTELNDKQSTIGQLERTLAARSAPRPMAVRAVSSTPQKPSESGTSTAGLQQLKGIGPTTEVKLNQLGISTVEQMANLSASDIERIVEVLPNFERQSKRYSWPENAARIAGVEAANAS